MIRVELDVHVAQDGFALDVRDAAEVQVLGLVGPSGAGKTTLLEVLAGLRPATGVIRIGGRTLLDSANGIDVPPRARRVGYVPQDALLFPHLTVRGNLLYGARDRSRLDALAGMLEIASGGERQRVALGRALASAPDLLLLDEPLGALDPARRDRILPYVLRARQALGVAMVWVTHDLDEVELAADRVLALDQGRVRHAGSAAAVLAARSR
jgi:molybdate transport system ATP-binding protein